MNESCLSLSPGNAQPCRLHHRERPHEEWRRFQLSRSTAGLLWFDEGVNSTHRHRRIDSPLGTIVLTMRSNATSLLQQPGDADDHATSPDGPAIVGIHFDGQAHQPSTEWFGELDAEHPLLDAAVAQLQEYFAGARNTFDLPLAPDGTDFQRSVWTQLLTIEPGSTSTYGHIARALRPDGPANSGLAQGVGQAVGHNPISIVVPCHRVLGSDGSLTGYAGGLERKRWLLDHDDTSESRGSRLF